MIKINLLIFSTLFPVFSMASISYEVETFCQDLNIILMKIEVHSTNIENANTTRDKKGGYYKRIIVSNCKHGDCELVQDKSPPKYFYEPNHPDANIEGYVAYPNVSVQEELSNLIKAQRSYDLVIQNMPFEAQDLLVGKRFKECLDNYQFFEKDYDFQEYVDR